MSINRLGILLSVFVLSNSAFAATFAGNYNSSTSCQLTLKGQPLTFPAGKIVVSENIPVSDMTTPPYPAILVQAGDETTPVLVLGIGVVTPFQYGTESYSMGAYASDKSSFVENYFVADANGNAPLQQTIKLVQYTNKIIVVSKDWTTGSTHSCAFQRN